MGHRQLKGGGWRVMNRHSQKHKWISVIFPDYASTGTLLPPKGGTLLPCRLLAAKASAEILMAYGESQA
jgi:hypothetical protein